MDGYPKGTDTSLPFQALQPGLVPAAAARLVLNFQEGEEKRKKTPLWLLGCVLGAQIPCTAVRGARHRGTSVVLLIPPASCCTGVNQGLPALWKTKRALCGIWAQLCPFNNL